MSSMLSYQTLGIEHVLYGGHVAQVVRALQRIPPSARRIYSAGTKAEVVAVAHNRYDSPSTCSLPPMGRFVTGSKAPCSPSRTFVLGGCLRPRGGERHLRGADWLEHPTYEGYHRACVVQGSCAVTQSPRTASGDAHSPR